MRALRERGRPHSRKRIARLMRAGGLCGKCPRRFVPCTTQSGQAEPIAPNRLAEQPKPTAPNQVWVSDITDVRTAEGWLYVAAILDLYSRRIVGWATGASLAAELVLAALARALLHRRPPAGLLYHRGGGGEKRGLAMGEPAIAACSTPAATSAPRSPTPASSPA